MTEFTDYDEAMLHVMADFEDLRSWLLDHVEWFADQWFAVSDEQMPFFEIHERQLDAEMSRCTVVFVLSDVVIPIDEIEGKRRQ